MWFKSLLVLEKAGISPGMEKKLPLTEAVQNNPPLCLERCP